MGTEGRGTAILVKGCYLLANIQRIPKGRGISAHFNGIRIIKIYASARFEKKREREDFYNGGVASILINSSDSMILAGDFNCVLITSDCTGLWGMVRSVQGTLLSITTRHIFIIIMTTLYTLLVRLR